VRTDEWRELRGGRIEIVGLHTEEDQIHQSDRAGVVGGGDGTGEIARDARQDREALNPERLEMGPPGR
jgi:hypothetical protein